MNALYLAAQDAFIRWHETALPGTAIVYLPGLGFPAVGNFLGVATHPAMGNAKAILIDYLGSGASDHPLEFSHGIDAHAACIAAVLDHLGCGPCPVVGYSMGGSVAIELAIQRPDLVSKLVICEGNLAAGGGAASRRIAGQDVDEFVTQGFPEILKALRSAALDGDAFSDFITGAWAHVDPRGLHGSARSLVNIPAGFAARFQALALPRTYVYGEKNDPRVTGKVTPDMPDPKALLASGVAVATVPGVGHDMMLGNLDGFVDVLARALK